MESKAEETHSICDFYMLTERDIIDKIIACLNLAFSIPAIMGNLLILFAIRRTSSMGLPSKVLLGSLAFSDFCVGLIVHPSFALYKVLTHNLARCIIGLVYDFTSGQLSLASLLTMVFISLDKFMALHLKMRYRTVVTSKRSIALVAITWTLSLPWSASYLFTPRLYFVLVLIIIPFSFLVTSIVFAKIYSTLRRQQDRLSVQSRETRSPASLLAVSRYKKSVTNMLYVYCALLAAYLPTWIVLLIRIIDGKTTKMLQHASELALVIVLINSTVNPGLYLWRIKELRQASSDLLRRIFSTRREMIVNGSSKSSRVSEGFSTEPKIQLVEIGLENCGMDERVHKGLVTNRNATVLTTHF